MSTTLVLGGTPLSARRHAVSLLPARTAVTVIVPQDVPVTGDPDGWHRVQTVDLTRTILRGRSSVFVDSLETWAIALLDKHDAWSGDGPGTLAVREEIAEFCAIWANAPYDCVALSREVSFGAAPEDDRALMLRDVLEELNAGVSGASTRTHLVLSGRVLDLSQATLAAPARN